MSLLSAEVLSTVLNFAVVVFILWHFGRKPIGEFFQTRSKDIATHVSEARTLSTDAKKELSTWESKSQNAQAEIARQLEDAKSNMAKFRETTLARATAESKRISEESATVASAEALRAKRQLRKELALESLEQARQYLEHHVDSKDSKKLLTDYLERV
jgi:F-type H+-transporting ATPase subunit b